MLNTPLYLALVMDLYSRTIIGWSMVDHMQAELVEQALLMALGRRCPDTGLLSTRIKAASTPAT